MAIDGDQLTVRLNVLEKVMALRGNVKVPLSAVGAVDVQDRPLASEPALDVVMGFAATGAPLGGVATVGPRAKYLGGRALIIVWLNRLSVVVHLRSNASGYRLLIVSDAQASATAAAIRRAATSA